MNQVNSHNKLEFVSFLCKTIAIFIGMIGIMILLTIAAVYAIYTLFL